MSAHIKVNLSINQLLEDARQSNDFDICEAALISIRYSDMNDQLKFLKEMETYILQTLDI